MLGVDWSVSLPDFAQLLLQDVAVQGNLDPQLLNFGPEIVHREAHVLLESMRGRNGHIVNPGHGIHPTAKVEPMEALVETVKGFR